MNREHGTFPGHAKLAVRRGNPLSEFPDSRAPAHELPGEKIMRRFNSLWRDRRTGQAVGPAKPAISTQFRFNLHMADQAGESAKNFRATAAPSLQTALAGAIFVPDAFRNLAQPHRVFQLTYTHDQRR